MGSIKDNDCYGDRKKDIVDNFYLNPLAYLKLIPGQKKNGCCGELKDRFVIFAYNAIANKEERGVFFVGYDCAHQIIDLVNEKKKRFNKPLTELPPLFDPLNKGFSNYAEPLLNINKDILDVILMIASIWDVQNFKGTLPYLLSIIGREPLKHPTNKDILSLNAIVGKDAKIADLKANNIRERIAQESTKLYCPPLLSLRAVLEHLQAETQLNDIYI